MNLIRRILFDTTIIYERVLLRNIETLNGFTFSTPANEFTKKKTPYRLQS